MRAWLLAHLRAGRAAGVTARVAPLSTLLSVLALASALVLPVAGWAVLDGLAGIAARFDTDSQIALYLAPGVDAKARDNLVRILRARPGIKSVRTVTREQALAELEATEGVRDLLAGLAGNPLPDTLVVRPAARSREALTALKAELGRLPGVASAQGDAAWVERLDAIVRTGALLIGALAALLGLAVVAVTFNTIRLQVLTRRDEIEVGALVGATSAWLRRPFLYFGTLQGATAGIVATGAVAVLLQAATARLGDTLASFGADAPIGTITWQSALTVVLASAILGWLGAWLSTRRTPMGSGRI
jgi:cell division transport system permease protein